MYKYCIMHVIWNALFNAHIINELMYFMYDPELCRNSRIWISLIFRPATDLLTLAWCVTRKYKYTGIYLYMSAIARMYKGSHTKLAQFSQMWFPLTRQWCFSILLKWFCITKWGNFTSSATFLHETLFMTFRCRFGMLKYT